MSLMIDTYNNQDKDYWQGLRTMRDTIKFEKIKLHDVKTGPTNFSIDNTHKDQARWASLKIRKSDLKKLLEILLELIFVDLPKYSCNLIQKGD